MKTTFMTCNFQTKNKNFFFFVSGMTMSTTTEKAAYIRSVLKKVNYKTSPTVLGELPLESAQTIFPQIIFFDPKRQFNLILKCPYEDHPDLTSDDDLSKGWCDFGEKHPRLLLGISRNIWLVSRIYNCAKCRSPYLAHDPEVLKQIPRSFSSPFLLFHKVGVHSELHQLIINNISKGISFSKTSEILKNMKTTLVCQYYGVNETDIVESKLNEECFKYPRRSLITDIFLSFFNRIHEELVKEFKDIKSEYYSVDHTYRSCEIVQFQQDDGSSMSQFQGFFICLNEKKQIVKFALTKTSKLSELDKVFSDAKELSSVKSIFSDNCCKDRKALQQTFSVDCKVQLDIWHATNRIIRSVGRKKLTSAEYKEFCSDVKYVVRQNEDRTKERKLPTAEKDVIVQNLNILKEHWCKKELPEDTVSQINNLLKHAELGCLSGIKVGEGTFNNENVHRKINDLFHDTRSISLRTFVALFTVFAVDHNRRMINNILPIYQEPFHFYDSYDLEQFSLEGYGVIEEDCPTVAFPPAHPMTDFQLEEVLSNLNTLESVCINLKINSAARNDVLTLACSPWKGEKNMKFSERDRERNLADFSREVFGNCKTFEKAVISGLKIIASEDYKEKLCLKKKLPNKSTVIEKIVEGIKLDYNSAQSVMKLCDEVGCVFILVSGSADIPVQSMIPEKPLLEKPLIILLTQEGFFLTKLKEENLPQKHTKIKTKKCGCGKNSNKGSSCQLDSKCPCVKLEVPCYLPPACVCQQCTNVYGTRFKPSQKRSKCNCKSGKCNSFECQCFKTQVSCNEPPRCSHDVCQNPNDSNNNPPPVKKRKLESHAGKLQRENSKDYYQKVHVVPDKLRWTRQETLILIILRKLGRPPSRPLGLQKLVVIFQTIAGYIQRRKKEENISISVKTSSKIKSKLMHLKNNEGAKNRL